MKKDRFIKIIAFFGFLLLISDTENLTLFIITKILSLILLIPSSLLLIKED